LLRVGMGKRCQFLAAIGNALNLFEHSRNQSGSECRYGHMAGAGTEPPNRVDRL
jgi:hypothetical protein